MTISLRRTIWGALLCLPLAAPVLAADDDDNPASRPTVMAALAAERAQYGTDAVFLQGSLITFAIRGGSVLEAIVAIAGVSEHAGQRYLAYRVDPGIVYQPDVSQAQRLARLWVDVFEPAVRQVGGYTLPADGVTIDLTGRFGPHADRTDLQRQLQAGRIRTEAISLRFLKRDAADFAAERLTRKELLKRVEIHVDGQPAPIALDLIDSR